MKRYIAVLLSLLIAFSLTGCFLLPKEANAPELPLVTPYSGEEYLTAQVVRGDLSLIHEVNFTFRPTRIEKLSFAVTGKSFGSIQVAAGDNVEEGQLVAWLDVSDVEKRLASVEDEISRLKISLTEAEEAYELAREAEILQGGNSTVSSDARAADAEFYRSSLELQEAKRAELLEERESLRLYATIDGTVTYAKKLYDGTVSNKGDAVVTITDTASSVFTASTEHYALFPLGSEVTIVSGGVEYPCIVKDADVFGVEVSRSESELGKKAVCLEVIGAETPAESNAKGTVTLELDSREDVLLLPVRAVFTVEDDYYVYYEDENGLKNARRIECGLANNRWIEVTSGLEEGDTVILR